MFKLKQITTAIAVAATMIITAVSVSAETVAEEWIAVYQIGAPSSVNKTYVYEVPAFGKGYIVDCTYFTGGHDSLVIVTTPGGNTFRFTNTGTYQEVIPYNTSYGNYVTFKFSATQSTTNCVANGRILYNM